MDTSSMTGHQNMGPKQVMFGDKPVFDCPSSLFYDCFKGRKKNQAYKTYLKDTDTLVNVQDWMKQSYKNKSFILRNASDQSMFVAN